MPRMAPGGSTVSGVGGGGRAASLSRVGSRARPAADRHRTLSEPDSKALLAGYGVPVAPERVVHDAAGAATAATEIGFPVVVKLAGDAIAHKTERGLVRLGLTDAASVHEAAIELLAAATPEDGEVRVLVAPMLSRPAAS